MLVFDTICALATPPYKSALSIVRLSGDKSLSILSNMIKKDVNDIKSNTSFFAKLYKDKNDLSTLIDECVITIYRNPKSYTGFDSVDFSLHGSMLIVENLLDTLCFYGARRALKGEFSSQAYFNKKMDLLKAEGINDLINARSKRASEIALNTMSNKNSMIMNDIKTKLLDCIASLEYYVENRYIEEDDDSYNKTIDDVKSSIEGIGIYLKDTIDKTIRNNKQYDGIQITIAGNVNVGKSTLLNAILKEDKAIVSDIAGTTRDVVEGEVEKDGILYHFKDTAGIRKSDDKIENLGIEKSIQSIKDADVVLLLSDCDFKEYNKDDLKIFDDKITIKVATKKDISGKSKNADISICSLNDDLNPLFDLINSRLDIDKKDLSSFLGKREQSMLIEIYRKLNMVQEIMKTNDELDLISDTLHSVISDINSLMGNDQCQTMEDIYQTLFSKFCLGK